MRGSRITGTGGRLPDKVVTNHDLATRMDTDDEWIRSRTGIEERRIGGTTTEHAVEASRLALERAGVDAADLDLVILATTTPDRAVPGTSPGVALALGARCGAIDINAACSGWVYGLVMAHAMIGSGMERILVAGAETLSRITDWEDRTTAILFADGGGAAVVEATDGPGDLLGWDLAADGDTEKYLFAEMGGYLEMNGKEVFRHAVSLMADSSERALAQAGLSADDVDVVIPHQANIRIIEACCKRLGVPPEKAVITLHFMGNTSAATVPFTLDHAVAEGRLSDGDVILFSGFGAGMTAASAVMRWSGPTTG
ncbi:MAG: beta-ketoacyl-ACP synthase III [Actinomycetota bacterium]